MYSSDIVLKKSNFPQILNVTSTPALPFVNITLNDSKIIRGYIDSGASISLIDFDVTKMLKLKVNPFETLEISVANSSKSKTEGSCTLKIPEFGNHLFKLHVLKDLPTPLLVGFDILKTCDLNFRKNKLFLGDKIIPIFHDAPTVENKMIVNFVNNEAILNDHLENQIRGMSHPHFYNSETGVIFEVKNNAIVVPDSQLNEFSENLFEKNEILGQVFDFNHKILNITHERNPDAPDRSFQVPSMDKIDVNPDLPNPIRQKYIKLINKFRHLFIYKLSDIGKFNGLEEYSIKLTSDDPVLAPTYRIPLALQDKFKTHIEELLKQGLIEKSFSSKYNHGFIAVPKKDGNTRWASDMRRLNAITEPDSYHLPLLDPILSEMIGNKVFSQIDLFSCYHQFPIKEADRDIFTFQNPLDGQRYRWTRVFFGLRNIPAWISRVMATTVMNNKSFSEASLYIDDLSLYNQSHEEMLVNLHDIFMRIDMYNLKIKSSKCKFGYSSICQFGYEINCRGKIIDPRRAEKLSLIKIPSSRKQLHTSIGAIGYFRGSIKNFARFTSVLTPLLSDKVPFKMTKEQTEVFQEMINSAKNGILAARPNLNERFIITTDASGLYYGGVLSQEYNDQTYLLAVHSAHFTETHQAWSTHCRELLAVVKICEKFETELLGKKFLIRTDSAWVTFLIKNSQKIFYDKPGPVVRLLMRLSRFEFDITHTAGDSGQMKLADLMSRLNSDRILLNHKCVGTLLKNDPEIEKVNAIIGPCPKMTPQINLCLFDENLSEENSETENKIYFTCPRMYTRHEIRELLRSAQKTHKQEILDQYKNRPGFDPSEMSINGRLIVPKQVKQEVLKMSHMHFGQERQYKQIRNLDLFWDGFSKDVQDFCISCASCQRVRKNPDLVKTETDPRGPTRCFQSVAIDILTVGQGEDALYILGMIDHLSHFVKLGFIPSPKIKDALNLLTCWVLEYNITEAELRGDNAFNNNEVKEFCNVLNIKTTYGIPANSRSNNEIERKFRSVIELFRTYNLNFTKVEDLKISLSFCEAHLNATPIRDNPVCPFECVYGMTPRLMLLEPLPNHVAKNLLSFAQKQYSRLLKFSNLMQSHYDRQAEQHAPIKVSDLYTIGRDSHVRKNFLLRPPNDLKFTDLVEKITEIISI